MSAAAPCIEVKVSPLRGIALKQRGSAWEVSGYGSTWGDPPDSFNDVVAKGAFAKSLAARSTKFLLEHRDVIGLPLELREDGKGLWGRWEILDTQRGKDAYTLAKAGALDALSIGYVPIKTRDRADGVRVLEECELYEVSLCAWGANPNALVTNVKSAGGSMAHDLDRVRDRLARRGIIDFPDRSAIGRRVAAHPELAALKSRGGGSPARVVLPDLSLKAITTPPVAAADNRPDLATAGTVAPGVLDYLPQLETTSGSVQVPRSSAPSGAGAIASGALKPEVLVSYAAAPLPMAWIAGHITATSAVLDDADGLPLLIDGDLRDAVLTEAERQVLQGAGGSEMLGIWGTSGVLTLTATAGQELNALIDAVGDVVAGSKRLPTVIAVSMASYPVVLKQIAATGAVMGAPNVLGVPLVPSAGLTDGRALVGCGPCAPVFYQKGYTIETGWTGTGFLRNIVTLRGELSAVVAVSKPAAWCAVSGLGTGA